ncbi:MAG: alkaline phosphatase family protein [Thermodesulfobacteriota bacterium]
MSDRPRVIVLGLDGGTFALLDPWMADGTLPHLARLAATGSRGPLRSTVPPVTGPAWVSFMTGKGPGRHGVYDFVRPTPAGTGVGVVSHASIRSETLFTILARHGRKVSSVNVPLTYPLPPVAGCAIAGMLTPNTATDIMFPPDLGEQLAAANIDYVRDVGWERFEHRQAELVARLRHCVDERVKACRFLMGRYPADLFLAVFTSTDRIQHSLWHLLTAAPANRRQERVKAGLIGCYQAIDAFIGEVAAGLDAGTSLVILSDHGFGPLAGKISLNTILAEAGLLVFHPERLAALRRQRGAKAGLHALIRRLDAFDLWGRIMPRLVKRPRRLSNYAFLDCVDWSRTRAYAVSNSEQGIYINLRGRQAQGIVEPGADYEAVREEVATLLAQLTGPDGRRLATTLLRREEIYAGPFLDEAPDLVVAFQDGEYVADVQPRPERFPVRLWQHGSGTHRMDGILMLAGSPIQAGGRLTGAAITDVAPTILHLLDLPCPDDMDGRIITEALTPAFRTAHPPRSEAATGGQGGTGGRPAYTAADKADLEQRLEELGYL